MSTPIPKERIKTFLKENFFSEPEKKVLAAFLFFKNHTSSAPTLSQHLGYTDIGPVNSIIGKMGKKVAEKLAIPLNHREDGSEVGWDVLFDGIGEKGNFVWQMKVSVSEALMESGMQVLQRFDKGDQEYFSWMKENPEGFVLNTTPGPNTTTFILHRSGCFHIGEKKNQGNDSYTKKDLIKIASNDPGQIEKYALGKKNFKGDFQYCRSCKPSYQTEGIYPDEISEQTITYKEGVKKTVYVNMYDRSSEARKNCIEHYGSACQCCGINFEQAYGEIGKDFIHVHHKRLVSEIGEEYQINPIEDLVPLCPNCHAMVHKRKPPFSVEELKRKMGIS